jgi:hypothetical protein
VGRDRDKASYFIFWLMAVFSHFTIVLESCDGCEFAVQLGHVSVRSGLRVAVWENLRLVALGLQVVCSSAWAS